MALTHDVLCSVVGAARNARQEREARDAAEAQLAAQRERVAATRRALRRSRKIAIACVVLAVAAAGAAAFGIYGKRQAQATRAFAEAARGESERLIVYLLDDFYRVFARRPLDYYNGLPADLRGTDTQRDQALAQTRCGTVLRNQGRRDESRRMLAAAIPTLDALRTEGDASEATAIGLALGLIALARLDSSIETTGSMVPAQRAVDVLQAAARLADASVALRRAYAAALNQLGFIQQRTGRNDAALARLQAAPDAYRGIDSLRADNDAAANFAISAAWLMDALTAAGRPADARRLGEEARAVTTRLLDRHPTHMPALRARALVLGTTGSGLRELLRQGERVEAATAAAADWLLLSRIDPTHVITVNNLGATHMRAADALWELGRPRDAAAKYVENRAVQEAVATTSVMMQRSLSQRLSKASRASAELGQLVLAGKHRADSQRFYAEWKKGFAPTSFEARFWPRCDPVFAVEQAAARGDRLRARESAKGAREGLLEVDPGDDPGRRRLRADMLRRLHVAMARVEIEADDFAAAEQCCAGWPRRGATCPCPTWDLDATAPTIWQWTRWCRHVWGAPAEHSRWRRRRGPSSASCTRGPPTTRCTSWTWRSSWSRRPGSIRAVRRPCLPRRSRPSIRCPPRRAPCGPAAGSSA